MKVTILNDRGVIRLKYRWGSKYEYISLGLAYTEANLIIAKAKASQIESDIIFNCYESKEKYELNPRPKEVWNFPKILDYYLSSQDRDSSTLKSIRILQEWCDRSPLKLLFSEKIDEWILYLKKEIPRLDKRCGYADSTIFLHLKILRSAIYLAHEMDKIPQPKILAKACKLVKVASKKEIKVYSKEEISLIIHTFRNNPNHSYYADLVYFRFLTGCRPSEVIALTWDDIIYNDDKTYIRFNKRFVDGILKEGLKNRKPFRYVPCNDQLQLLLSQIPRRHSHLMFPAVQGGYLDNNNLVKRHWNIVVNGLVVIGKLKYHIPFYDQRHCFGTIVCRQTTDLKTVANIMGNTPEVLQKNYLANDDCFKLPEL